MRYFIQFSYDGSNYHGWQVQPNASSVQAELNRCLSMLLREDIYSVGAGRTDTGVSAKMMFAHFDIEKDVDVVQLAYKLNRVLPPDIAVQCVKKVDARAHTRFDAKSRTYHYFVYTQKSPFNRHYAARFAFPLDFDLMNEAAQLLLEENDFTSFSKLHTDTKTNICHITQAQWEKIGEDEWRFEITADRFLRNMVRSIVGTLIDVGRGKISLERFKEIIKEKNRCAASESVPGNALFLVDIVYPESIWPKNEKA